MGTSSRAMACGWRTRRASSLFAGLLLFASSGLAVPDPGSQVADYYYSRYAYRQALPLWQEVARKHPSNVTAALRVAELKLLGEGRDASREWVVEFLNREGKTLPVESLTFIHQKVAELHEVFLTDEGQTLFYQALARIRRDDCEGAMPGLAQALALEKGNARLVREKSRCERKLGQYANYFESLISLRRVNPLAPDIQEELAEASLQFRQPERAIAIFESRVGDPPRGPKARLLFGVALVEEGKFGAAHVLLEPLSRAKDVPPILNYSLGKIFSQRANGRTAATSHLELFLSKVKGTSPTNGWDPFHIEEKAADARKILSAMN